MAAIGVGRTAWPIASATAERGFVFQSRRKLSDTERKVGAHDPETAVREGDVPGRDLEMLRGQPPPALDKRFDRLVNGGSPHDHRPRRARPMSLGRTVRITLRHDDLGGRDAQSLSDHLGKRGFVALAGRLRAAVQRDLAGLRYLQHRALRSEGRAGRRLDMVGNANAAQAAAASGQLTPLRQSVGIDGGQGARHVGGEVAAVVGMAEHGGEGNVRRSDHVASAQLDTVDSDLLCGHVDHALEHVLGFGIAGAAVGVHGHRVGEDAPDRHVDRVEPVNAALHALAGQRRHRRSDGREIGAHVGGRSHAKREEATVAVEGELDARGVIAPLGIADEGLAAIVAPFDGPAELAGSPHRQHLLRIERQTGAERTADVRCDHADGLARYAKHMLGEHPLQEVGPLTCRDQRVLLS